MSALLSPAAKRDILKAVRWIAKDNPPAARALRDAVIEASERISRHIHIGTVRPELAEPSYRFLTLTGFPYVVIYDSSRSPPMILRVLHAARDLPQLLRDL